MGMVNFDEPMLRLFNQGIILGEDSEKMSKSAATSSTRTTGRGIWRRHHARLSDVHRPVGRGRSVEQPGHRRRVALPGAGLDGV